MVTSISLGTLSVRYEKALSAEIAAENLKCKCVAQERVGNFLEDV